MLKSTCPEKMSRNDDWDEFDQFEKSCNEQPKVENKSSSSSPSQTNIPEDEGDLLIFDLKV